MSVFAPFAGRGEKTGGWRGGFPPPGCIPFLLTRSLADYALARALRKRVQAPFLELGRLAVEVLVVPNERLQPLLRVVAQDPNRRVLRRRAIPRVGEHLETALH